MPALKIIISLDEAMLNELDGLIKQKVYLHRSKAIQDAVKDKIERISKNRLARECAKLNADQETKLAEEGVESEFVHWPEY